MARKRRSLTTLLMPSFLQASTSSESSPVNSRLRAKSDAAQTTPPPAADPFSEALASFTALETQQPKLLDDDPFANLSNPGLYSSVQSDPFGVPEPLSPTSPKGREHTPSSLRTSHSLGKAFASASSPPSPRSRPAPPLLSRPAYTKPAFKSTPSLPSLRDLAQGELVPTRKIRRGRVGATLPLEPWNLIPESSNEQVHDDSTSSWLADLDAPVSPGFERSPSFDQDQFLSARLYEGNFNMSSDHLPTDDQSMDMLEDLEQNSSPLSRMPSDPCSSSSWETLSTSDHSHTSSLTMYSVDSDYPSCSASMQIGPATNQSEFDLELYGPGSYSSSSSRSPSTSSFSDQEESYFPDSHFSIDNTGFYPGTSAETIRPRLVRSPSAPQTLSNYLDFEIPDVPEMGPTPRNSRYSDGEIWEGEGPNGCHAIGSSDDENPEWMSEAVDSGESTGRYRGQFSGRRGNEYLSTGGRGYSGGRGSNIGSSSGSGGRDDEDDDDGRRRGKSQRGHEISATDFVDSDSEEDMKAKRRGASKPVASGVQSSDSDDVPLARSIPTALKAQKTIRREVRDENAQRRKERQERAALRMQHEAPQSAGVVPSSQQPPQRPLTRPRTATLPSEPMAIGVDELTKKLMDVQTSAAVPAAAPTSARPRRSSGDLTPFGDNQDRFGSKERSVRPMKSFHRPRTAEADLSPQAPMPTYAALHSAPVSRSYAPNPQPLARASADDRRLDRSKSTKSTRGCKSNDDVGRSSAEQDAGFRQERAPPMPPLPSYETVMSKPRLEQMWQQRVFIGDLQRFNMIEVGNSSSAQDVVGMLERQGEIRGSGWMLFELAQDFGMERPIRSFELLVDITNSWNKEKTVNLFVLKRTQLAPLLSLSALPTSSPTCRGYIDYEVKRGKWSKRWMELREHSLWLSKRDSMKDEVFLCKLSNFDVYSVTRIQKAPKPFVFAVKSTDNLAFFENTSDYLHSFSCKEKEGLEWMTKILLARSYVLHQERRIVTSKPAAILSRSGTRKAPRAQPLVNVSPPVAPLAPAKATFEPGSLLAKYVPGSA